MKRTSLGLALLLLMASAIPALANTVKLLDFSGLQPGEQPVTFYAGGSGSLGSVGVNYGVSFSPNSLVFTKGGAHGNFLIASGTTITMNVSPQFAAGLKFAYLAVSPATASIWSGPGGTGFLLGTLSLNPSSHCITLTQCWWTTTGISLPSTASSVTFVGSPGQMAIDNIRLGKAYTPPVVVGAPMMFSRMAPVVTPEPSSIVLLITGLGLLAALCRKGSLARTWDGGPARI
jgi:hypothetical protein